MRVNQIDNIGLGHVRIDDRNSNLKSIQNFQCGSDVIGGMWSNFLDLVSTQAAVFWTRCSLFKDAAGLLNMSVWQKRSQ